MPKYLIEVSYSPEGVRGLLKDGGTKRRKVAEQALASAGATIETFYFAFGATDAYVIADAPDHASITAATIAVNASGAVKLKTTVLITPDEIDQAVKKPVSYRAPGA